VIADAMKESRPLRGAHATCWRVAPALTLILIGLMLVLQGSLTGSSHLHMDATSERILIRGGCSVYSIRFIPGQFISHLSVEVVFFPMDSGESTHARADIPCTEPQCTAMKRELRLRPSVDPCFVDAQDRSRAFLESSTDDSWLSFFIATVGGVVSIVGLVQLVRGLRKPLTESSSLSSSCL